MTDLGCINQNRTIKTDGYQHINTSADGEHTGNLSFHHP